MVLVPETLPALAMGMFKPMIPQLRQAREALRGRGWPAGDIQGDAGGRKDRPASETRCKLTSEHCRNAAATRSPRPASTTARHGRLSLRRATHPARLTARHAH